MNRDAELVTKSHNNWTQSHLPHRMGKSFSGRPPSHPLRHPNRGIDLCGPRSDNGSPAGRDLSRLPGRVFRGQPLVPFGTRITAPTRREVRSPCGRPPPPSRLHAIPDWLPAWRVWATPKGSQGDPSMWCLRAPAKARLLPGEIATLLTRQHPQRKVHPLRGDAW